MSVFDISRDKDIVENIKIGDFITGGSLFDIVRLEKVLIKRIPTAVILFTDNGKGYVSSRWKD